MKCLLAIFFGFSTSLALAQDFSFSPGPDLDGQMDVDGYGVHQIDIVNESEDTLWLTWRMIENTMPAAWDVNLCDNVLCYGEMPNMADMNPIAPDSAGFIRITTYPQNFAGSGEMHFWIYKTGSPQDHSTITFTLSAGVSASRDLNEAALGVYPNPSDGFVRIELPVQTRVSWTLFDTPGRVKQTGEGHGPELQLDLQTLPAGRYWLCLTGEGFRRTIALQRR